MQQKSINITVYRWAGSFGPFKVKIPCGECSLTHDIIQDTLQNELNGLPIDYERFDWLSHWWKPLLKGGWHAPIVLVNGKVLSQGLALNRGLLTQAVIEAHSQNTPLNGNHIFGKNNCLYCQKAKALLDEKSIAYHFHDVITQPRALYEMLARVKPMISAKTPITVPQIWLDGQYVGGWDQLSQTLG